MENQVSTHLYKLDYKTIYENYLKQDFWGKRWIIFKHGNITITAYLHDIEVCSNKLHIGFEFLATEDILHKKPYYRNTYDYNWELATISLNKDQCNEDIFQAQINGKAIQMIHAYEARCASLTHAYIKAKQIEDAAWEELHEKAKRFLDKRGIKSKVVREAYIDRYVDDNKTSKHTDAVVSACYDRLLVGVYLMYTSIVGDMKRFEYYKGQMEGPDEMIKQTLREVEDYRKQIELHNVGEEPKELTAEDND